MITAELIYDVFMKLYEDKGGTKGWGGKRKGFLGKGQLEHIGRGDSEGGGVYSSGVEQ